MSRPELSEPERLLKGILRDMPRRECKDLHHTKLDHHEYYEQCPVEDRLNGLLTQARLYFFNKENDNG